MTSHDALRAKRNVARLHAGLLALVALGTPAAYATPISYSELVFGDLSETPNSALMLDVGANTISGTTHLGVNLPDHPHFDLDFDGYAFTLPAAMQLAAVSLAYTTTSYNAKKAEADYNLCVGVGSCLGPLGILAVSFLAASPIAADFGLLPLAAGTYSVVIDSLSIAPLDPTDSIESWSVDYVWTYSVVAVSEPDALALLALCLLVLSVIGRSPRSPSQLSYDHTD